jgi:hypothetical protein
MYSRRLVVLVVGIMEGNNVQQETCSIGYGHYGG